MIKIGVLGAGHLGKIHIKNILNIPDFQLVGFFDPDKEKSEAVVSEYGIKAFASDIELIHTCDAVDIVTPTVNHYGLALKSIQENKHVFIEKPITYTVEESMFLMDLVKKNKKIKVQVGHVERFNPAYKAALPYIKAPLFIECIRISGYNPRGTDVSVIQDLMIHDIDLVLQLFRSDPEQIMASGVPVFSHRPDIANARIEFKNGFVANFTASRASLKRERKMRIFQKNAYIQIDFLNKKTHIYRLKDFDPETSSPYSVIIETEKMGKKEIEFISPPVQDENAIMEELRLFGEAILQDKEPAVNVTDGFRALMVSNMVIKKIEESLLKTGLI